MSTAKKNASVRGRGAKGLQSRGKLNSARTAGKAPPKEDFQRELRTSAAEQLADVYVSFRRLYGKVAYNFDRYGAVHDALDKVDVGLPKLITALMNEPTIEQQRREREKREKTQKF